jgi:hypothetical protein
MDLLEYSKLILSRVSFCPELFKRELQKSIEVLEMQDISMLRIWCLNEFGKEYPELLVDSFQIIPNQQVKFFNKKE